MALTFTKHEAFWALNGRSGSYFRVPGQEGHVSTTSACQVAGNRVQTKVGELVGGCARFAMAVERHVDGKSSH